MIEWITKLIGEDNAYEVFSFVLTYFYYLIATLLFCYRRKHRSYFYLRLVAFIIVGFFFSYGLALLNRLAIDTVMAIPTRVFCYYSLSSIIFLLILFCFDEPVTEVCLLWCSSLCAQHIVNKTYPLIQNIFGINDTETISLIHSGTAALQTWEFILYFVIYISGLFLIALFFRRNNYSSQEKKFKRKVAALSISFTLSINGLICLSRLFEKESFSLSIFIKLFTISFCFLILFIIIGFFEQNQKEQEYVVIKELLHQEKAQFENVKTNMEAINTKVHDLKKIINRFENKLNEQDLQSLKSALDFYDSTISTGNDVLDVILSEKSLLCRQNNIKFTSMVDGQKLDMFTPTQLYSIFGNIMDNAIRASKNLDVEKRFISLTVKKEDNHIIIEESNFYEGTINILENNLIATSKKDKAKHGFGIKSIVYLINRFGGNTELKAKDNCFTIRITLSIKQEPELIK